MSETLDLEMGQSLKLLRGLECWSTVAGPLTGPRVSLDFGQKLPRIHPRLSPNLSEDEYNFVGEYWVYIQNCAWRIESETEVICGSRDGNAPDGPMVQGLKKLIGQRVEDIEFASPAYDLTLHFSNSLTLRLFCDQTNVVDPLDNYRFASPVDTYTVGVRSRLRKQPRKHKPSEAVS